MNPKRPFHVNIVAGLSGRVSDKSIDDLFMQARAAVDGVKSRLKSAENPTEPVAYMAEKVFQPESISFDLDTEQDGVSSNPVNYVLRSGTTYQVPIIVGGDGIFFAHGIRISFLQRLVTGTSMKSENLIPMFPMLFGMQPLPTDAGPYTPFTTKFSLIPKQPTSPWVPPDTNGKQGAPAINFRWNIQSPVSGIFYANELLPMTVEGTRSYMPIKHTAVLGDAKQNMMLTDGAWHRFASPWQFNQKETLVVLVRPLTDVLQFHSSLAGNDPIVGLAWDDRENGIRNQSVTIRVEVQGERTERIA